MDAEDNRNPNYQAYLLRLWREGTQTTWRASLQSTATEQLYHFATIESLFAFLDARMVEGKTAHVPTTQPHSVGGTDTTEG